MSCNCKSSPCTGTPTCTCPVKDLSAECVTYKGADLACSGITSGTILSTALTQLDVFICNKFQEAINYLTLINIGGGAEVYKGISGIGNKEIRTIEQGDDIIVTQQEDTILISNPPSTETNKGVSEIATQAEVDAGTDDERYVTPLKLKTYVDDPLNLPVSTETNRGVIEIATQAEVDLGADDERAVTPLKLKTYVDDPANLPNATEIQRGIAELATNTEVQTGVDTERIVTPSGLSSRTATETRTGILEVATSTEANALTADDKIITPAKIPIATDTQQGIAEFATQAESDALADMSKIVSPGTVPIASETQQGVIEIATQAEVDAGTDTVRAVTPATLQQKVSDAIGGGSILSTTVELNTWSYASATSVAHNIGNPPLAVLLKAVCTAAEGGYSIGNIISISANGHRTEDGGAGDDGGITFSLHDNNNSDVLIADRLTGVIKTGSDVFTLTPTSWDLRIIFLH